MELETRWLGRTDYREAWGVQHAVVARRAADEIADTLLLLDHPPVLTLGRQATPAHIRASATELAARGIDVIRVERGGEVTYHGPGQLVGYPIVKLADRALLLRPFVRALAGAMIDMAAAYGVGAGRRDGHPGCWCDGDGALPRKLGALGLRIERGVSYHGIGLNVTTDVRDFDLIDPCGMPDVVVTSIARELGWPEADGPTTESVKEAAALFAESLGRRLETLSSARDATSSARDATPRPPVHAGR